jgi:serine/threonine protein kinase
MPSDEHEEPPVPPTTGLIASKYQLVRLIGRGGMGAVWEGRHASLGTRVAIKFIDTDYADSQEARTRFDNEARAAATIQSKHAIQIYDHGVTEDGKPYIVMELLTGEPLDQRIDRVKRLSLQETARILRQVARALQRAHERGIVHRDLKPENIFLVRTPDEDDEIAKVLDFGIAKFKRPDGMGVTSSTKTGAVLGTPFYMSPEQARGLREVDHRTDLWSMGVIAFKCVAGVLPFDGVSVGDLLVKICTSPPPIPSHVVPGLPTSFDAWFARALERDPARRFASAQELSDALAYAAGVSVRRGTPNLGDAPTIAASASGSGAPGRISSQPGRISDGPSFSGSGSGPAPIAATVNAAVTSAPFTASAPRVTGSSSKGVVVAAALAAIVGAGIGVFAIVKLAAPSKGTTGSGSTVASTLAVAPPGPVGLAIPATVTAPPGDAHPDAGASHVAAGTPAIVHEAVPPADAALPRPEPAGAHGRAGKGHGGKQPAPAPGNNGGVSPATPPGTAPASPPSAPPAATTPAAPPPAPAPKPAPTTIDPGY